MPRYLLIAGFLATMAALAQPVSAYCKSARNQDRICRAHVAGIPAKNKRDPATHLHEGADEKAAELNSRGLEEYNRRHFSSSLSFFTRASGLSSDPVYYYNRINALIQMKQFKVAVKCCDEGLALFPECADLWQGRAEANYNSGCARLAIDDCDQALKLLADRDAKPVYYLRYECFSRLSQHDKAIESLARVIQLNEQYKEESRFEEDLRLLLVSRSIEWDALGKYDNAVADLDKAIELNSKDADVYWERARTKINAGMYESALIDVKRVEDLVGKKFVTHALKARIYAAKREHWQAETELKQAFNEWPESGASVKKANTAVLLQCALASLQLGKFSEALSTLELASSLSIPQKQESLALAIRSCAEKHLNDESRAKSDAFAANRIDKSNALVQKILADKIEISRSPIELMTMSFVLSALAPSLFWLWWFRRQDSQPEPAMPLLKSFLFGAVLTLPIMVFAAFAKAFIPPVYYMCVFGPVAEECGKFLACKLATDKEPAYDEPVDAVIYAAATALGFAFAENLEYFSAMDPGIILGRSLISVPAHALFSVWWGVSRAAVKFDNANAPIMVRGLMIASVLHGLQNTFLFQAASHPEIFYPVVGVYLLILWLFFLVILRKMKRRSNQEIILCVKLKRT